MSHIPSSLKNASRRELMAMGTWEAAKELRERLDRTRSWQAWRRQINEGEPA